MTWPPEMSCSLTYGISLAEMSQALVGPGNSIRRVVDLGMKGLEVQEHAFDPLRAADEAIDSLKTALQLTCKIAGDNLADA